MAGEIDLDRLVITVRSPDGNIAATLRRRGDVRLSFRREDTFDGYRPDTLRAQLKELLPQLERTRVSTVRDVMTEAGYEVADPDTPHWNKRQRQFQQAQTEVSAVGFSPKETVGVAAVNLSDFHVDIDADAFEDLDAKAFIWHFGYAYARMMADHQWQVAELRREYFPR